jgi:glycosyltransferase involved in cell wall biosynthesis
MRILYVAIDQKVPGTVGGSIHVQSVAEGLARRGHEVHVATTPDGAWPEGHVSWHALSPPLGLKAARWTRSERVARLARFVRADLVMERYYNFGGEGVLAARRLNIPAVLEVNAPMIDVERSAKSTLDRAVLFEPMRRWRERLARMTDLFVTPTAAILPASVDRARVLEVEWGADTQRFRPGRSGPAPFPHDSRRIWCIFAGAFRSWHGAEQLTSALARLHRAGDSRFGAVLIGDGPERPAAERAAAGLPGVHFAGKVPHEALPRYLAYGDIGVAPFDASRHAPLQIGFYWSPLKVFEYMASGLPVVAPRLARLEQLIEHGHEGLLYDARDPHALDATLAKLADTACRQQLGANARERAVREFSWDAHCEKLEQRLLLLLTSGF